MLSDAALNENINKWALFNPVDAKALPSVCERIAFHSNDNGSLNLKTTIDGTTHFFHSLDDPEQEAHEWFRQLDLKDIQVVFVYGVGLGYYYDAIKQWLRQDVNHYVVFIEKDLEVIRCLLQTEKGSEILEDRQAWICYQDAKGNTIHSLGIFFVIKVHSFSALHFYELQYDGDYGKLKSMLSYDISQNKSVVHEFSGSGSNFLANFFRNLLQLPHAYYGNSLFHQFKKIPAIICGAGPSLAKNVHLLNSLQDRALIFAGGTSMNALNGANVIPHFGVAIDPNPAQFTRLIMNQAYQTPYFYRNRIFRDALDLIQGDHLYITGSGGHETAKWFEQKLGIEGLDVQEGFNVINFSVSIARAMGCDPIIVMGVDLAYSGNQSYCPGVANHPLHDRRTEFKTKSTEEELINYNDIEGKPTITLWKWIAESGWFSGCAESDKKTTFINATEGGIGFRGITNIPLKEAAKDFLAKQYDMLGMVHAAIETARMPDHVTYTAVVESLKELQQSLTKCQSLLEELDEEYVSALDKIDKEEEYPPQALTEKGTEALRKLGGESGYVHLLKVSGEINFMLHSLDFRRLKADEGLLKKAEIDYKKFSINRSNYAMLGRIATAIIKLLDDVLKEASEAPLQVQQITTSSQDEGLQDSQKPFDDATTTCHEEKDDQGALKLIQYRRGDLLHGPSTYYSKQGTVLSHCRFVDGIRQGKAYTYYSNGTRASIQEFKDGQRNGLQQYFYSSGAVKSTVPYSQGMLDGEVAMYYPDGRHKRQIFFSQGKRHGFDRLWNRQGKLVLEAQFEQDAPTGFARQWNDNGALIKEVTYDPDAPKPTVRGWDDNGILKASETAGSGDYFDQLAVETGHLAQGLEQMIRHVVTPMIRQNASEGLESPGASLEDLQKLEEDLKKLQETHKQLLFESGLDGSHEQEPIWKSPSSRREMQRELEKLAEPMQEQMKQLESMLTSSIEAIKKKMEEGKGKPESKG